MRSICSKMHSLFCLSNQCSVLPQNGTVASTTVHACDPYPRQAHTRDDRDNNNDINSSTNTNHVLASDVHAHYQAHSYSLLHRPPLAARSSDSEHSRVIFEPPESGEGGCCEPEAAAVGQRAFVERVTGSTDLDGGWCTKSRLPRAGERVQVNG